MTYLTDEERDKFIQYLDTHADVNVSLIEQMQKISAPEVIINKYRAEIVAFRTVIGLLHAGRMRD